MCAPRVLTIRIDVLTEQVQLHGGFLVLVWVGRVGDAANQGLSEIVLAEDVLKHGVGLPSSGVAFFSHVLL